MQPGAVFLSYASLVFALALRRGKHDAGPNLRIFTGGNEGNGGRQIFFFGSVLSVSSCKSPWIGKQP